MNANEECFQAKSLAGGRQMQYHQYQKLKVEDALSFLDQVKYMFGGRPQAYNDFLDIMKEFKSGTLDTPGVIQRVANLFRGHPELIVGFNTFLPLGYRIEVGLNEQVQVSIPGTNLGGGTISAPSLLTIHPGLSTTIIPPTHSSQSNHSSHSTSSHSSLGNAVNKVSDPTPLAANGHPHTTNSQSQDVCNQNSPAHTQSSGGSPSGTPQADEFKHAINYVNKVKARFQGQPHVYMNFFEILHTYQKEQLNLKNGVNVDKPLTEAEVYAQVAKIFQNQDDLLQEFGQFLQSPDANGVAESESAPVGLARSNTCRKLPTTEIMGSKVKKGLSGKDVLTCKVYIGREKEKSAVFLSCGNFVLKCGIALLICFLTGMYAGCLLSIK